jgi:hypothetical protein
MAAADHNRQLTTGNRIAIALIVTGILSLLTLGTAFGLLASGIETFWIAFPIGFGGILPIVLGLVFVLTSSDD